MDVISERKRSGQGEPGWSCRARLTGVDYEVWLIVLDNGTTKPDTWGVVRRSVARHAGPVIWEQRVPASVSPREILRLAGLINEKSESVK
ncbi:MAG: hypothetical protein ABJB49_10240 [Nitrospirota bacterium]